MNYDVYFAPEGRCIATVEAKDARSAIRKAPQPYRRYLGEMYALVVTDNTSPCDVTPGMLASRSRSLDSSPALPTHLLIGDQNV
jgi:hypothetical protein